MNQIQIINRTETTVEYNFTTVKVCSKNIIITVDNQDTIVSVKFIGGCNGNGKAIDRLVRGLTLEQVVQRLKGVKCGNNTTSCADQLAIACELIMSIQES